MKSLEIAELAAKLAEDRKADDVVVMDMRRISGLCDYFVICSATSNVRAKTIAENVEKGLKAEGSPALHRDGLREGAWIVLDFGSVIMHVFQANTRSFYNIEQLWGDAPRPKRKAAKDPRKRKHKSQP